MKRARPKFISLLLIAVLLVNILPASAGAVSQPDPQPTATVTTIPNPDYVKPGNVREMESRREENVKHFLLPDNTVQAVVYADAVHRKDESGKWQDISNDLTLTEYKGVKFYTTADGRMVFAEKFTPNAQLWQLSENGYSIAMGITQLQLSADATVVPIGGVTVTNAPQRRSATTWHSVEEARVVDNTASIVYSNIKANTDLEYIMVGNDIKENIVVKSRSSSYSYQFNLTLTGLTAVLNEDGSISLADSATAQQQYIIPAPYMVDAAGKHSKAVAYSLAETGEGTYTLTVTADTDWINAEERAFPVKIDPTVRPHAFMDTYIDELYPNDLAANCEDLWLAEDTIIYIRGNIPLLPVGSQIINASLVVHYYYHDSVTTGSLRGKAYMVTQSWSDSTLTWNTALQMENFGLYPTTPSHQDFSGSVGAYENTPGTATFNIMHAVNSWKTGTPNYGIALRYYNGTNLSVIIKSCESAAQYRPYYTVTYTEQRLADGVYRLQNVGTSLYLDVKNGGYTAGTVVQQNSYASAENHRDQLFKITFLETVDSNNYYSIRPMTNSGMGLSAPLTGSPRYVTINTMSTSEIYAEIDPEQRWIISQNGSQYTLKNGNDTQGRYLASRFSASGAMVETMEDISDYTKWTLTCVPVYIDEVLAVDFSETLVRGDRYLYGTVVRSSIIGCNGPASYSVWETDGQTTDKASIDPDTGFLVAREAGDVHVRITFAGSQYTWYLPLTIMPAYVLEISHHYDKGMVARYGDAYGDIISYQEVCSEIFWQLFNLNTYYVVHLHNSCLDECKETVTTDSINEFCNADNCPTPAYHRTGEAIMDDAITNIGHGSPILTRVVWTGHRLNEGEVSNSLEAYYTVLVFVDTSANSDGTNKPEGDIRKDRIFTLLHELSHQLGAIDHYCYGEDGVNDRYNPCGNPSESCYRCHLGLTDLPDCVMSEPKDVEYKIRNGEIDSLFCDSCIGTGAGSIRKHLQDHH